MSHFKAQLIQLLDHSLFKDSNISFSKGSNGSSKYKAHHDKRKGSIICNEYQPKPLSLNDSLLYTSKTSRYNKMTPVNYSNRTKRKTNKGRLDYNKILHNGSMRDIHSENYNSINLPMTSSRIEKSSTRQNSIKSYLNEYRKDIPVNVNRPISLIKTNGKVNDSYSKDISVLTSKSFLGGCPSKTNKKCNKEMDDSRDTFNESIRFEKGGNNLKKSYVPKQNSIPFKKTKSYNRLLYAGEIDVYRNGFPSCDRE